MKTRFRWAIGIAAVLAVFFLAFFSDRLFNRGPKLSWKLPTGKGKPAMAIGDDHGVILASDGSLWTWGEAVFGWNVLGLGNNVTTQASLTRIGTNNDWVDVAAGGSTTLALKSDGTIWAWGANFFGQLGDGTRATQQTTPVHSAPGTNWKQVATSLIHSVALKRDGTLWSWGDNSGGQLGNGTTNRSGVPIQVGTSTNWTRIWANLISNVGKQTDGSLWFWGYDYSRSKRGSSVPVPTRVSADTNWVDVGMGDYMVFAIKSDGTLWAWGREAHIFTGVDASANFSPVQVGNECNWQACASFSGGCPIFMKRDGSVWILDGSNTRGGANVTTIVGGLVTNDRLNCVADSDTLGGDPAMWVPKSLELRYQIGSSNYVAIFKEHADVSLNAGTQELRITRALYGNPKLFGMTNAPWLAVSNTQPAQFRRIGLGKDVVAFCGGRHGFGAALTSEGEVWMWGEGLAQHTRAIPPLQFLSSVLNRGGVRTHLGDPQPIIIKEPVRLGINGGN